MPDVRHEELLEGIELPQPAEPPPASSQAIESSKGDERGSSPQYREDQKD
ncbi:MAG TPA: hypothetical protein PKW79_01190 [Rhabdochlamydiaceae bacterium]|nr:hypothetical protein [Rhabdochlamydiaceae bacterium]